MAFPSRRPPSSGWSYTPEYLGNILDPGGAVIKTPRGHKVGKGWIWEELSEVGNKIHCIKIVKELIKHIKMWPLLVRNKYLHLLYETVNR